MTMRTDFEDNVGDVVDAAYLNQLGTEINTNTSDIDNLETGKQPVDTDLTAIAALTSAADKVPYATGAGAWALATLTAAGRALIDDADAAAQRTTLGLAIGTNVQAYDAELAALAGLVSAANKLPYFTGSGTASLADLTSFARSILDDTDAAGVRATIGAQSSADVASAISTAINNLIASAPGTLDTLDELAAALGDDPNFASTITTALAGKQPLDSDLTAIAALTSAANKMPYATGAGTWSLADLTAAGRALIDDADATAQRVTLGLVIGTNVQAWDADLDTWATKTAPSGTVVGTSDTQTLTNKRVTSRVSAQSNQTSVSVNSDDYDMVVDTGITGNITLNNPTGTPTEGQRLWYALTGTAARAISYGTAFEDSTVTRPTTTVTTARLDIGFVWNSATSKWRCVAYC